MAMLNNQMVNPSNSLVLVKSLYFCGPGVREIPDLSAGSGANSEIESFTQACEFGSLGSPQPPCQVEGHLPTGCELENHHF